MTRTSFLAFTGLTALVVVGAFLTTPGGGLSRPEVGAPFYPNLDAKNIDRAAKIEIWVNGRSFTIYRKDKQWVVKQLKDYPADLGPIRKTLNSLAAIRPFEKKTSDPKRLGKLDLEDPSKKGASSKRVRITDTKGVVLADLVIGKANANSAIIGQDMVYVRKMKQNQAWLAVGDPQIQKDKLDWTHKRIVDVDPARVRRVLIMGPKEKIEIAKAKPADKEFKLVNLPEGRKPKGAANRRQVAELGNDIDIYDVQPLSKVDFSKSQKTVRVETFDGLIVQMKLVGVKKKVWVQYTVTIDEKSLQSGKLPKDSKLKTAADVRKEAKEMAARLKGWAYLPPVWARRTMAWKLEDLLIKEKKPKKVPAKKSEKSPPANVKKAVEKKPAPKDDTKPAKAPATDKKKPEDKN